jgi:hypothetical protein
MRRVLRSAPLYLIVIRLVVLVGTISSCTTNTLALLHFT